MTSLLISGRNKPRNNIEFALHFINYMCGLMLNSAVIGQIQDVVKQTSIQREKYRTSYNNCMKVLDKLDVGSGVKDKVSMWFMFEWQTTGKIEKPRLPDVNNELQYDISLQTLCVPLRRARLFRSCTDQCMVDLTRSMRSVLYTPDQQICVEKHVGNTMFIVAEGTVLRPENLSDGKSSGSSGRVYPDEIKPKFHWIPTIGEEVMLKSNARYTNTYSAFKNFGPAPKFGLFWRFSE